MPKMPISPKPPLPFAPSSSPLRTSAAKPNAESARNQLLHLLQQGINLQQRGQFLDAERCYQMVLQRAPQMPEANNLMGTIAMEAKDYGAAVEFFEKAVAGLPRDPVIRHNFGSALLNLREDHAALAQFKKAIDLKPGQVETLVLMATAYNHLSRSADALPLVEKALRMSEDHVGAHAAKADALINLGQMEQAGAYLKTMIGNGLGVARAYQSLSATKKFDAGATELKEVLALLQNSSLSIGEQSALHFSAAKMSNDAKLYDDAMGHYLEAKAVSAATYDIAAYERRVDLLINIFNPLFMGARKNFGDPSHKPIFIVGMPRSGTTLTEQIISSHRDVAGAGELGEMQAIARMALGDSINQPERFTQLLLALSQGQTQELAQRYLKFIARTSHDAARITDKMPHNFEHVGLIALLFPNASIVHCRRDAIDNCLSCYMNAFSEAHAYNADLEKLGRYYRAYNRLMAHWHKILPGRIFNNQYETLVENQEEQSRKLIAHCGLEWDETCLNYTENKRSVTTISRWQVRQPIYKTSMKRWKVYDKHLGPLISALGDLADVG